MFSSRRSVHDSILEQRPVEHTAGSELHETVAQADGNVESTDIAALTSGAVDSAFFMVPTGTSPPGVDGSMVTSEDRESVLGLSPRSSAIVAIAEAYGCT